MKSLGYELRRRRTRDLLERLEDIGFECVSRMIETEYVHFNFMVYTRGDDKLRVAFDSSKNAYEAVFYTKGKTICITFDKRKDYYTQVATCLMALTLED